jgi:putative ABC transport system permease protein
VVAINEAMAKSLWPNEDPVGKRITIADMAGDPWREIVGVVKNIKHLGLENDAQPEMYVPYLQRSWSSMSIVIRTVGDPKSLIDPIRSEVRKLDKDMPLYDIRTMEQLISELVAWPRFRTFLLGIFAAVSLVLSSIGIYGVMSYSVLQRTHEIGLRMALGAQKSDMLKLIVGQGMVLTLIGVAVGLGAAYAATRVLSSLLFQIRFTDVMTYALSALLLAVIALLASFFPARKAMKVDPIIALRYE